MNATWKTRTPRVLRPALVVMALMALARPGPARAQAAPAPAEITVLVRADAEIFFEGKPTTQRGAERVFTSPPLDPGKTYYYDVLARWKANGETVERTRQVPVSSGARVRVSFVQAPGGPAGAEGADKDQQVVRSRPTTRTPATSVNFRKELNLPFASLGTLGSRIEAARRAPDPVALAHAASELDVAEKVSGKTASLTSKQLIKEAAELAALRRQTAELRAVERVTNQVQYAEEGVAYLKDAITQAEKMTQQDRESFQRNEQPTSTPRQLVVNNYTTQYLDIYVNGSLMTQVQPGLSQVITIEQRWNPVVVTAYGSEDTMNWGPRYIWGRFTKYTWNIDG
jgi:uncharacterized protein (TIGR03000 family)